jgi:hypothetical protein
MTSPLNADPEMCDSAPFVLAAHTRRFMQERIEYHRQLADDYSRVLALLDGSATSGAAPNHTGPAASVTADDASM